MSLGYCAKAAIVTALTLILGGICSAQSPSRRSPKIEAGPKVTQIDIEGLKPLLKPSGKPLLINFWATWCDPCREEFPDLVKIGNEFRTKVDFITVSLDDLADIDRDVPKFLREMKSNVPAYLLHTQDDGEALSAIFKDWKGNLPLTILFDTAGNISYQRNGKVFPDVLRENIRKLLPAEQAK
jgi:thiol-disulfide isomerase/thioredoxin